RPFDLLDKLGTGRLTVMIKVEGHHDFAYYEAALRIMYPQRRAFFVPVHRTLSSFGGGNRLGRFLGGGTEKRPPYPL
ncbi:MAG: hypothetical protein JW896_13060, partial [Deltaproteobacteria bacterium]|nr:hypothetical protein [Deltaproteobacteria bacterium]